MKRKKAFHPPKDIQQFWMAPHCGPGTLDPEEMCGFCGRTMRACAEAMSEAVRIYPNWNHDGCILGDGHDDPEELIACGGSGFWCSGCGRFWAQNSCGESFPGEMQAADGAQQVIRDGKVYCVCGKPLATLRPQEQD